MRRILFLMFVVLVVLVGPAYATHKTTITVSCVSDYDVAFKKIIPDFVKMHPNINVRLITHEAWFHNDEYFSEDKSQLKAIPDVLVLQEYFFSDQPLVNLKAFPYFAGRFRKSIVPYSWLRATGIHNRLLAMPINTRPKCAYWREDIFSEVGVDFKSLKTLDDLYKAAGKITRDSDGDGKIDRWFMPYAGAISNMVLQSRLHPLVRKVRGRLVLDDKQIHSAFHWARKFHQAGYDLGERALYASSFRYYQNGEVAYEICPPFFRDFMGESYRVDGWRIASCPALYTNEKPMVIVPSCEEYLAIHQRAKHKREAWEFIRFVCLNKRSQLSLLRSRGADGLPSYMPCWKSPVFNERDPLFGGQRVRRFWINTAKRIPVIEDSSYDYLALSIIYSESKQVICGEKGIDELINDIQKYIDEVNRKSGKK